MEPFGFLVVDKPKGMTSHDVVNVVRRGIHTKRIGHAGTLDPMATGVLVLCIGAATRLSEYVMDSTKVYTATLRLGVGTDTYDAEGQIVSTSNIDGVSSVDIEAALQRFQGEVEQVPPMYSAIKQGGKKLYELARQGKDVERASRRVWMETALLEVNLPDLTIRVTCSAGTYIRSIAHDLGAALGVGAHLTALRRDSSGALSEPLGWQILQDAMTAGTWQDYLIDERKVLASMPEIDLNEQQTQDILHGRFIDQAGNVGDSKLCRAYGSVGKFIGILTVQGDRWKPEKVIGQG